MRWKAWKRSGYRIMTQTASELLRRLQGKTLVTAESLTGGMIGAVLTAVPGASAVYKGGVVSYTNGVKQDVLGVSGDILRQFGAVSAQTAEAMAQGVRKLLAADIAVSATGLAGPGGDEYGNPVGTVFVGFSDGNRVLSRKFHFAGDRQSVRRQTVKAALEMVMENV